MIVIKINITLKCSLFILADYFSINQEDHITNQSYIETTRIPACKSIHLTFSSKVHYLGKEISLILLTYQGNTWKKSWEYMYNDSQWGLHQLSLNISETKEDIRVSFFFFFLSFSSVNHRHFSCDIFPVLIQLIKSLLTWLYRWLVQIPIVHLIKLLLHSIHLHLVVVLLQFNSFFSSPLEVSSYFYLLVWWWYSFIVWLANSIIDGFENDQVDIEEIDEKQPMLSAMNRLFSA